MVKRGDETGREHRFNRCVRHPNVMNPMKIMDGASISGTIGTDIVRAAWKRGRKR